MLRQNKNNKRKNVSIDGLITREVTSTLYGIYFASSNTDFLLEEKKTRFSVRPDAIVNADRKTIIFDYSGVIGSNQSSIFDGFFRGVVAGTTLTMDGGSETTCNYIDETIGIPLTNFADNYNIVKTDIDKKIIIAIKDNGISSTTGVAFNGTKFIDLPQFTKTNANEKSTSVNKIINLLSSQSLKSIGVVPGKIINFSKTNNNNNSYTVVSVTQENGFEVVTVKEPITQEDVSQEQIIMSIYRQPQVQNTNSLYGFS
tara:strand:- start:527 stop:1297 length:771 start_codon:yes stop_codon:yes gene_type:complete